MNNNVHVGNSDARHVWPRARLSLNSKCLTAEQIKRVGRASCVSTDASVNEVRVMIEGKLNEMERDPKNVQVVVGATGLPLWGEDGEFLAIADQPSKDTRPDSETNEAVQMRVVETMTGTKYNNWKRSYKGPKWRYSH